MNHKILHEEANSHFVAGWNYDADRSSATQLSAIYKLLDERLPAAPMTVIESAPAPVEDTPTEVQTHFECRSSPGDYLKIDDSYLNVVDRLYIDFFTERSSEDSIGLTKEDARILARSILSIVGEN